MFIEGAARESKPDPALPAKIAYILYLAGPFFAGLPWIAAVVVAYAFRDNAPAWLAGHYRFQIRTFWIGMLPWLVSAPLCLVLIGFLPMGLLVLWVWIRAAKGLRLTISGQPLLRPASWTIG